MLHFPLSLSRRTIEKWHAVLLLLCCCIPAGGRPARLRDALVLRRLPPWRNFRRQSVFDTVSSGVRPVSTENSGVFAYHQKREAICSPWKACAKISVIGLTPGRGAPRNRGRGLKSLLEDLARSLGQYRSLHGERGLKSQGQAGRRAGAFGVAFRMGSVD